jgi:hypothetical protein
MRHFLIAFVFLVAGCGSQTPPPAPQPVANAVPVIDPQDYDRSRAAVRESLPEQDRPKFDKAVKLSKNLHQLDGQTGDRIIELARIRRTFDAQRLYGQIRELKKSIERFEVHVEYAQIECERVNNFDSVDRQQAGAKLKAACERLSKAERDLVKLQEEFAQAKEDLKALKPSAPPRDSSTTTNHLGP